MAICGYRLGYQRQLGADVLLTIADKEKPAHGGLGLVVVAQASARMRPNLGNRTENLLATSGNSDSVQAVIELWPLPLGLIHGFC